MQEATFVERKIRTELHDYRINSGDDFVCPMPHVINYYFKLIINILNILMLPVAFNYLSQFLENKIVLVVIAIVFGFLIALRIRANSLLVHEAVHRCCSSDAKTNDQFGSIASVFANMSFDRYRTTHLRHHKYLGNLMLDDGFSYEVFENINIKRLAKLLRQWHIIDSREPLQFKGLRLIWLSLYALYVYVLAGIIGCFAFFILPLFLYYPIISAIGDILEHSKKNNGIHTAVAINSLFSSLLVYLFFPYNNQYHLAHHVSPTVPSIRLADFHKYLTKASHSYAHVKKNGGVIFERK